MQHSVSFRLDIPAKLGILDSSKSPGIGQNSDEGISDFRISRQSLINQNCQNFRTSNDTDMKLGPVPKLDKRNTATSKKFDYDVMSVNCDVIVIFSIYGQFRAIRKPDSGRMICKTYIFVNKPLILQKLKTELKNLKIC